MRLVEFLNAARRQTRERTECIELDDPLLDIVSLIQHAPATPRAVVLEQALSGLLNDRVHFSDSEIFALDLQAIALLDALVSDSLTGRYSPNDLQRATHAARPANDG
jgi:hypothetical protein